MNAPAQSPLSRRDILKGGALIVYDAMIDDDRRENAFGLLMSLNMLVETSGGSNTRVPRASNGCGKLTRPTSTRSRWPSAN